MHASRWCTGTVRSAMRLDSQWGSWKSGASMHHPPRMQGHRARDLAIEFYEENCRDCPFRDETGFLPNLATAAAEHAAQVEAQKAKKDGAPTSGSVAIVTAWS